MERKERVSAYTHFLRSKRKANGDKLVESTIERYSEWIEKYFDKLEELPVNSEMVSYMNEQVDYVKSGVLHAAFKNYLAFRHADRKLIIDLEKTERRANALTSHRFLQSKVLSRGELRRLMNETTDLKMRLIISCLYDTACRRAELTSIKAGDIQLKDPVKHKDDVEGGVFASVTIMGKGKKSREVYLSETSVSLFRQLSAIENFDKSDKIFTMKDANGSVYQRQEHRLYDALVKHCNKILERHVHPHCMRHTKATHMADNGADIMDIAAYLGHSDMKVTQVYVEISSYRGKQGYKKYSRDIMTG